MKIRPMNDKLIVKRLDAEKISKGGIVIPETSQQKPARGIVLAAGLGKKTDQFDRDNQGNAYCLRTPMDVQAGDEVLFAKYSGHEVKTDIDGKEIEITVLSEADVLCVLEPDVEELKAVG